MTNDASEVVISGLSGRLPESDNIAEFREHLINGDDMITEDDRRWEPGAFVLMPWIWKLNHSEFNWSVRDLEFIHFEDVLWVVSGRKSVVNIITAVLTAYWTIRRQTNSW